MRDGVDDVGAVGDDGCGGGGGGGCTAHMTPVFWMCAGAAEAIIEHRQTHPVPVRRAV